MSSKRRTGLSEGKCTVPVDFSLQTLLAHRLLDDVNFAAQNSGQAPFEFVQAGYVIQSWRREMIAETYSHIDIVRGIFPTRNRTEK